MNLNWSNIKVLCPSDLRRWLFVAGIHIINVFSVTSLMVFTYFFINMKIWFTDIQWCDRKRRRRELTSLKCNLTFKKRPKKSLTKTTRRRVFFDLVVRNCSVCRGMESYFSSFFGRVLLEMYLYRWHHYTKDLNRCRLQMDGSVGREVMDSIVIRLKVTTVLSLRFALGLYAW